MRVTGRRPDQPARRRRPVVKAMRVALADDSVLLREGVVRAAQGVRVHHHRAGRGRRRADRRGRRSTRRTSWSTTSGCPRRTPTRGCRRRTRSAQRHPEVGVLLLSQYVETDFAVELVSAGAARLGYLLKDRVANIQEFTDAVRRVGAGGSVIDPEVVARLVGPRASGEPARRPHRTGARGARPDGRGPVQPGDLRRRSRSRPSPSRATSATSSPSWASSTRPTTTAESLRSFSS